jgi:PAS domain S-box-containing protein
VPILADPRPSAHAALRDDGLRLLADALDGFLYDWDIATDSVTRSAGLVSLLGYADEEVEPTAEWWIGRLHPDDAERRMAQWRAALADTSVTVLVTEYRLRHRDGRYLWVSDRARLVRDERGRLTRVVGLTTDLTARCRVEAERDAREDELRAITAKAEAANRAKSEFLAVMSHELRTPLNAIQGWLQLLDMELHGPVTPLQRDALGRIDRAQRHLLSLINEVLNFAKLDASAVALELRPVLVEDVLADVVPLVETQLATKHLAFEITLPESAHAPPVPVLADREKLGQVLLNLLANAAKFTPRGGRVRLALEEETLGTDGAARVAIRVHDTGIGIPPDRLDDIFEPFVQVDSSLTREATGTGLGLSISRELTRAMGGDIRVHSTPGHGSTFSVVLRRGA